MIEGDLQDVSLPGLLQLLAAESSRSYRLRIKKGGQHGDLFICDGHLLVATFGILEGLDALSEMLVWSDGEFVVERLPAHFKNTIRSNITLRLTDPRCFSDQCAFLHESNVGLNTELIPSRTFGTKEWQEALNVQPLNKEDYAVIAWLTDGRTMRQAMREFQFDLKRAIGILYRLLITRSVEVVRATFLSSESGEGSEEQLTRIANQHLAKHTADAHNRRTITVEFEPVDIGGARMRSPQSGHAFASTADQLESAVDTAYGATIEAEPAASEKHSLAAAKAVDSEAQKGSGQSSRETTLTGIEAAQVQTSESVQRKPAQLASIIDRMKDSVSRADESKADVQKPTPAKSAETTADKLAAANAEKRKLLDFNDDEADNFKKRLKKPKADGAKLKDGKSRDTQDLPAFEDEMPQAELHDGLNGIADEEFVEPFPEPAPEPNKVLNVVASTTPVRNFDERKTDPLPLVAIDIERLLNSSFNITKIGTLALTNPSLDQVLQQVLLDVERGKSMMLVMTDSSRSDAAVLATYKYSLDRGYIEHSDLVMALTIDLLLGRMKLEQYLLQRRRITGDQLRDLMAISERQGISLEKLLVAAGYVLPHDMERLRQEQDRFAQH